jgi:hypothetical protein
MLLGKHPLSSRYYEFFHFIFKKWLVMDALDAGLTWRHTRCYFSHENSPNSAVLLFSQEISKRIVFSLNAYITALALHMALLLVSATELVVLGFDAKNKKFIATQS